MTTIKKASSGLYKLIPTLLELDDVVCGEFKKMFKKLISDLIIDINNINSNVPMLYEKNIHHLNAINVIRSFNECIYCLINKLKGGGIFNGSYMKDCVENPEDDEDTYVEPDAIVSVLQDTFNITTPPTDDDTTSSESPSSSLSSRPTDIPKEVSIPRRI
jgi:hypothetical protein